MFPVELHETLLVLGRVGCTVHLMAIEHILRCRRRLSSSETNSPGLKKLARFIVQTRQAATAELIVEHDGTSAPPVQPGGREHVPVRDARSVIQHHEGRPAGLEVTENGV
jgi:hypothetical protein